MKDKCIELREEKDSEAELLVDVECTKEFADADDLNVYVEKNSIKKLINKIAEKYEKSFLCDIVDFLMHFCNLCSSLDRG